MIGNSTNYSKSIWIFIDFIYFTPQRKSCHLKIKNKNVSSAHFFFLLFLSMKCLKRFSILYCRFNNLCTEVVSALSGTAQTERCPGRCWIKENAIIVFNLQKFAKSFANLQKETKWNRIIRTAWDRKSVTHLDDLLAS